MVPPNMVLAIIPCYSTQDYPYNDRYANCHKPNTQGNPGTLHHPCKYISPQIIGPEQVDAQPGDFFCPQGLYIGS